jgi:hypothetical protein
MDVTSESEGDGVADEPALEVDGEAGEVLAVVAVFDRATDQGGPPGSGCRVG